MSVRSRLEGCPQPYKRWIARIILMLLSPFIILDGVRRGVREATSETVDAWKGAREW